MPALYELPWLLQDYKTNTGHGKLLLDDSLYPEAYATNVNEQVCMPPSVTIPSRWTHWQADCFTARAQGWPNGVQPAASNRSTLWDQ